MLRYLFVFAALGGALAAADFEAVRASIRKQMSDSGVPSVAVAVARDGRILWEEGFGWADREKRIPATEHTMYSLASISKPITATGLMLLVEAGKVGLDRPVNDYLAGEGVRARIGSAEAATVRRVANHTSGLPLHHQFFYADAPFRPPSMDETILRFGNLVNPPGERYQYSNLGFGILDWVIARVSGQRYADFMRERVFLPLGLTRTSVYIGPGLEPYAATRYGTDGLPIPLYEFDHPGASAVYASAHDLVRFGMFHLKAHLADQRPILTDASIDAMQRATVQTGANSGYGIGWGSGDTSGYHVVNHGGGMPGVATVLDLLPAEKLAVVVLCNAAVNLPPRIADEIIAAVLPGYKPEPRKKASAPPRAFDPPGELVGEWKGRIATYRGSVVFTLRVLPSGDVHARIGSQMKMLLNDVAWGEGRLFGLMPGSLPIEEAGRGKRHLRLNLTLRGKTLNGSAVLDDEDGPRYAGAVTQWVELTKE